MSEIVRKVQARDGKGEPLILTLKPIYGFILNAIFVFKKLKSRVKRRG